MSASVNYIAQVIEKVAPKAWAEDWDNSGLLVGDGAAQIERLLLTLDVTPEVVQEAIACGAQIIIAHHPILFRPLKNLRSDNPAAEVPLQLIRHGIACYAAHTNLDQSVLSSSWALSRVLRLRQPAIFAPKGEEALVKLAVFVPGADVEKVRSALVQAGVGEATTEGEHSAFYAETFFLSTGEGMFKPLPGAEPALGRIGELTRVGEAKLESILPERLLARAVKALKKAHPYEEPAYDIIPLRNHGRAHGYGVIGYLPQADTLKNTWQHLREALMDREAALFPHPYPLNGLRCAGNSEQQIRKVAIVNGSGGSFVPKAIAQGADLLIAGDLDHHQVLDALQSRLAVGDIGHFLSEAPMLRDLAAYLQTDKLLSQVEIIVSRENTGPWR